MYSRDISVLILLLCQFWSNLNVFILSRIEALVKYYPTSFNRKPFFSKTIHCIFGMVGESNFNGVHQILWIRRKIGQNDFLIFIDFALMKFWFWISIKSVKKLKFPTISYFAWVTLPTRRNPSAFEHLDQTIAFLYRNLSNSDRFLNNRRQKWILRPKNYRSFQLGRTSFG